MRTSIANQILHRSRLNTNASLLMQPLTWLNLYLGALLPFVPYVKYGQANGGHI